MQLEQNYSTAGHLNRAAQNLISRIRSVGVPPPQGVSPEADGKVKNREINIYGKTQNRQWEEEIKALNEYTGWGNFNIGFSKDEATNTTVVEIIDRDTGETIRQIPPDAMLKLKTHMRKVLGLVFDRTA